MIMQVRGLVAIEQNLNQSPQIVNEEMKKASDASLLGVVTTLKDYPAAPPNSTYRRTRLLGRTWVAARPAFRQLRTGWEGRIGNPTPYAGWVQGRSAPGEDGIYQSAVHAGRWTNVEQAVEQNKSKTEAHFEAAGERIARRLG